MMQIPNKLQHGDNIRTSVFNTVNAIIDYLHASKLRKSAGIDVVESPSGTTLNLVQKSSSAPQVQPVSGGNTNQDLSVSITGNTAMVSLSGSTQTVQFVAGSNVSITGNTNGQVIVSATGGTASSYGPPDFRGYPIDIVNEISNFPVTLSYAYPVWIVGYVQTESQNDTIEYLELDITRSGVSSPCEIILGDTFRINSGQHTNTNAFSYWIPANTSFTFSISQYDPPSFVSIEIYPCLIS